MMSPNHAVNTDAHRRRFALGGRRLPWYVRARFVRKTCPRCRVQFAWFHPLPSDYQRGPWRHRYVSPTLVCQSCGARMHAHVRPTAWIALLGALGAVAVGANQFGPRLGEMLAQLPTSWSLLPIFMAGGAMFGLIIGLVGRWGTVYELSNEP